VVLPLTLQRGCCTSDCGLQALGAGHGATYQPTRTRMHLRQPTRDEFRRRPLLCRQRRPSRRFCCLLTRLIKQPVPIGRQARHLLLKQSHHSWQRTAHALLTLNRLRPLCCTCA
jgi:hypothetical protein